MPLTPEGKQPPGLEHGRHRRIQPEHRRGRSGQPRIAVADRDDRDVAHGIRSGLPNSAGQLLTEFLAQQQRLAEREPGPQIGVPAQLGQRERVAPGQGQGTGGEVVRPCPSQPAEQFGHRRLVEPGHRQGRQACARERRGHPGPHRNDDRDRVGHQVRRLRHVLEPDSVHEVAVAVTATPRAADGPATTADLAEAAMP